MLQFFVGTNYALSESGIGNDEAESERLDLNRGNIQRTQDEWNENRTKQLDFINKRLHQKNEARSYINYVDEAMMEYYRVLRTYANRIRSLPY